MNPPGSDDSHPGALVHYVIVRRDLPVGLQAANIIHAAGESSDRVPEGSIAVALHADDEEDLEGVSAGLALYELDHTRIVEGEGPYAGQLMAIGVEPLTDRAEARRVLSALPLVR